MSDATRANGGSTKEQEKKLVIMLNFYRTLADPSTYIYRW